MTRTLPFVDLTLWKATELSRLLNGLIAILAPFLVPLPIALLVAFDLFHYVLPVGMPLLARLVAAVVGALSIEFFSVVTFSYIEKVKLYNLKRQADDPTVNAMPGWWGVAINLLASGAMLTVGSVFPAFGWDVTITASFIPYGFLLITPFTTYYMLQMVAMETVLKRQELPMLKQVTELTMPPPQPERFAHDDTPQTGAEPTRKPVTEQSKTEQLANLELGRQAQADEAQAKLITVINLTKLGKSTTDIKQLFSDHQLSISDTTISRYRRLGREEGLFDHDHLLEGGIIPVNGVAA